MTWDYKYLLITQYLAQSLRNININGLEKRDKWSDCRWASSNFLKIFFHLRKTRLLENHLHDECTCYGHENLKKKKKVIN